MDRKALDKFVGGLKFNHRFSLHFWDYQKRFSLKLNSTHAKVNLAQVSQSVSGREWLMGLAVYGICKSCTCADRRLDPKFKTITETPRRKYTINFNSRQGYCLLLHYHNLKHHEAQNHPLIFSSADNNSTRRTRMTTTDCRFGTALRCCC